MTRQSPPLSAAVLRNIDAYWRAANYLSIGQIYLYDNPLLKQPLTLAHIKPRLLGHWGTTPGLNFIYVHLNRVIEQHDLNVLYLHVRGFKEEGTTTTPFDMVVLNDLDRFHLAADVIARVSALGSRAAYVQQAIRDKLIEHKQYIDRHGEDMPEIRNWR